MAELLMNQFIKIFIAACLGMLLVSPLQAGLYKWTDEQGNVHYSQKPPRDVQYEKMKVDKAPPPSSTASEASSSEGEVAPGSKALADEEARNKEIRSKNCAAAKQNLRAYSVYRRVKDETGKIRLVPQEEREEKIKQAKKAVAEFCD